MEKLFKFLLAVHIVGGTIGLFTGLINLSKKKGGKNHILIGNIFTYSMLSTGFAALLLAKIHPNDFLFIVGVFTIYLVGTGKRYVYFKLTKQTVKPTIVDWALSIGMLIGGLFFILMGVKLIKAGNNFGIVPIVFALIGIAFAFRDIRYYQLHDKPKNFWLTAHLQRMTGGFIAALTAFLVVNAKYLPQNISPIIYWLLPTIVLVPLIVRWTRKFKRQ